MLFALLVCLVVALGVCWVCLTSLLVGILIGGLCYVLGRFVYGIACFVV